MDDFEEAGPLEIEIEVEVLGIDEVSAECEKELEEKSNKEITSNLPNSSVRTNSNHCNEQYKVCKNETNVIAKLYPNSPSDFKTCCNLYHCNKLIPKETALQHRQAFQKMSKEHQDIVIMSFLQAHRRLPVLNYDESTTKKKNTSTTSRYRKRNDTRYFFCDLPICRKMYLFLHDVGIDRYESICKHFDENGITPRVHKLKNVKPKRQSVLNENDIESMVKFIKLYGDQFGSRMKRSKINGQCPIKLPLGETKSSLHRKYCEAIRSEDVKQVARTTFLGIWKKYCPHIRITRVKDQPSIQITLKGNLSFVNYLRTITMKFPAAGNWYFGNFDYMGLSIFSRYSNEDENSEFKNRSLFKMSNEVECQ